MSGAEWGFVIFAIIAVGGGTMLILNAQAEFGKVIEEIRQQEALLNEQAKIECSTQSFYDSNFERCEEVGVRPQ
jgi:hypothetical protein